MTLSDVEIITPDGRFVSIRVPTFADAMVAGAYHKEPDWSDVILNLITLCATLDGEALDKGRWCDMYAYEMQPIMTKVTELLASPPARRG